LIRFQGWTPRAAIGLLLALGLAGPARAQSSQGVAAIDPRVAKLGEKVRYTGYVVVGYDAVQWIPPSGGDVSWGRLRARRSAPIQSQRFGKAATRPGFVGVDTLYVETEVSAFRLGEVTVPGLRFRNTNSKAVLGKLPDLRLVVMPVLSAADSNAELRPARGPLAAPWWENIPWLKVIAVAVILAALALLVWVLIKRRRKAAPKPVAVPRPSMNPAARALAELAALRQQRLPELGRFDEHALAITRIARRYLEAIDSRSRPGFTTRELLAALEVGRLGPSQRQELERWLTVWDGIKFARVGSTTAEAARAEEAVETLIRSTTSVPAAAQVA
jgi:hypothetical protein